MKRFTIYVFLLLAACKQEYHSIPAGVIPMDKMAQIMADMHIVDAVASTKAQEGLDEKMLTQEYYMQVYKNLGVSKEDFIKSYRFYESDAKLFNKLYGDVLGEISKREAAIGKK